MTPPDILALRTALGLNQPAFAQLSAASTTAISNWERGFSAPGCAQVLVLRILADAYEAAGGAPVVACRSILDDVARIRALVRMVP